MMGDGFIGLLIWSAFLWFGWKLFFGKGRWTRV